jgi:hypothetical protein
VLTEERMTGATIKAINPVTTNPGTKIEASQKHRPLIIRENEPKLTKLSGRDNVDKTGFTEELTKPITAPAIKAAGKFASLTPGKIISTTNKLKAVASIVKSVLCIFSPYSYRKVIFNSIDVLITNILSIKIKLYSSLLRYILKIK